MKKPQIIEWKGKPKLYCFHCDWFYDNVPDWKRCHPEGDKTSIYNSRRLVDGFTVDGKNVQSL